MRCAIQRRHCAALAGRPTGSRRRSFHVRSPACGGASCVAFRGGPAPELRLGCQDAVNRFQCALPTPEEIEHGVGMVAAMGGWRGWGRFGLPHRCNSAPGTRTRKELYSQGVNFGATGSLWEAGTAALHKCHCHQPGVEDTRYLCGGR